MCQRREQATLPAGKTTLVVSGSLGTISGPRGNRDAILARPLARVEAPGEPKAAAHDGEKSTLCAKNSSAEGTVKEGPDQLVRVLHGYLNAKRDRTAALKTKLNLTKKDESATEVQAPIMREDGNQSTSLCGWNRPNKLGDSCVRHIGQSFNWAQTSFGFLDHLENMWKRKACHEVEQFRGDLDTFKYTMPLKTEQQLKALNRSQLTEYIGLLHKDNEYIGQLAVESKTRIQRMSAEIDYLNQQVQSLKHELEVQAALYLDKMKRHPHKAI